MAPTWVPIPVNRFFLRFVGTRSLTPRTGFEPSLQQLGAGSGSEVSLRNVYQDRLLQLGLGQQLFQPGVLAFKLFLSFRIIGFHAAVLRDPPRPGGLRNRELATDLFDAHATGDEFLPFSQLADDLLWRVTSTRHQ